MNGKQLKAIRKKLGWTQVELAKELRTTENTVARWERDERGITEPMAKLIEIVYASESKKR
jgi:transcriptional regulator with XRE-family HTH domain